MIRTLVLAFSLVSAVSAADVVQPGFESNLTPYPVGAEIRNLADGTTVTCDGVSVQHWDAAGALLGTLGSFTASGTTGLFVVDPSGTFVLAGQSDTGEILSVDLAGGGATIVGSVPGNGDAAFDSPTTAIISATLCGDDCGNTLLRLDLGTGATTTLAAVEGVAGPVALDNAGDLYFGTQIGTTPVPAGASSVLRLSSAQLASPPSSAFQPDRELVVVEVESSPPATNWTVDTSLSGFTGSSYYRWDGPDLFSSPGSGIMTYDFEITVAGNYLFYLHNRHDDPQPDQDNDVWVRIDGGAWDKVFSNNGVATVGTWNWFTEVDPPSGSDYQANYTLSAGSHTLEFSGRSNGFMIDRFVFVGNSPQNPFDLTLPESTFAPYNESHAAVVASGFDGATSLVHDPGVDQLFLISNHAALGTNGIYSITPGGTVQTLMAGTLWRTLGNLDFVPGGGAPVYLPYQPTTGGRLGFTRKRTGVTEHRSITPDRPTLTISGTGATTGTGSVTIDVEGAVPGGLALLAYAPASGVGASELPVVIGGLPLVHTALPLASTGFLTFTLPCDSNGDATLSFASSIGVVDVLAVQAVVLDGLGTVVGSSTLDLL
jgi:hypothetical protein